MKKSLNQKVKTKKILKTASIATGFLGLISGAKAQGPLTTANNFRKEIQALSPQIDQVISEDNGQKTKKLTDNLIYSLQKFERNISGSVAQMVSEVAKQKSNLEAEANLVINQNGLFKDSTGIHLGTKGAEIFRSIQKESFNLQTPDSVKNIVYNLKLLETVNNILENTQTNQLPNKIEEKIETIYQYSQTETKDISKEIAIEALPYAQLNLLTYLNKDTRLELKDRFEIFKQNDLPERLKSFYKDEDNELLSDLNTGMRAKIYNDLQTGNIVVSFAGIAQNKNLMGNISTLGETIYDYGKTIANETYNYFQSLFPKEASINDQTLDNDIQYAIPRLYKQGVMFVEELQAKYPNKKIIITGHSQGGALSQYVALKLGLKAYVFNSLGVFKPTYYDLASTNIQNIQESSKNIKNIFITRDFINDNFMFSSEDFMYQFGARYKVGNENILNDILEIITGGITSMGSISNHFIVPLVKALKEVANNPEHNNP